MLYLISYDIHDDKKRIRIMKLLKEEGYHLQKSVFLVDCCKRQEAVNIYQRVLKMAKPETDRVFMVPLCNHCLEKKMVFGEGLDFSEPVWIV